MLALLQRVRQARVEVDGHTVGAIDAGLLILVCAERGDTEAQADKLLAKILKLRIFSDDAGKMNRSVQDVGGGLLIVSQFTLAADLRGNRPGFSPAASPDEGKRLYEHFTARIAAEGIAAQNGIFGADMDVSLVNQGPVTIWLASHNSPTATADSAATPWGASSTASAFSRTPTPLMLIGRTTASATSGTTANQIASGCTTPSERAIRPTATAPPICTMKLQPTAWAIRLGRCW